MITRKKENLIILLVCLYALYAYLSINIVLPALPHLANVFNASQSSIKLSITTLFLGYSIAQLIWGILSDRYGRRFIILMAIIVTIIGSLLSAVASSIILFSIARFIEGIGSGFGPALGRIVAKDALDNKRLHICITYVVSIVALMPAIAPVIGGQILHCLGWRAILYTLALFGIIIYGVTYTTLPETIKEAKTNLSMTQIGKEFTQVLSNRIYMGYFLLYAFALSGLITFYAMAPYLFVTYLHISSSYYGWILLFVGCAYIVGATLNRRLVHRMSIHHLLCIGFGFSFVAIILLLIFYLFFTMNVATIILPICFFTIACGFISPTANAAAMSSIKGDAGIPVSLLGFGMMAISTVATAILSLFTYNSLLALLLMVTLVTLLSIVSYYFFISISSREIDKLH